MLSWLRANQPKRKTNRPCTRLGLEALEDRCTPANVFVEGVEIIDTWLPANGAPPPVGINATVRVKWGTTDMMQNLVWGYSLRVWIDGDLIFAEDARKGLGESGNRHYVEDVATWRVQPGSNKITVLLQPHKDPDDYYDVDSKSADNVKVTYFTPAHFQSYYAPGQKFTTPLAGTPFKHWTISDYVDLNPGIFAMDYRGKSRTFDDNDGLNYRIKGFGSMDNGVPVLAAAEGRVIEVRDGEYDRNEIDCADHPPGEHPPANYIEIIHANGWTTRYSGLRKNSVAVSVGDYVRAGDAIGLVGSSGCSPAPQLHFVVKYYDRPIETYLSPSGYWASPQPYAGDSPWKNAAISSYTANHVTENSGFAKITVAKPPTSDRYQYNTDSFPSAKAGVDFTAVNDEVVFGPGELFKDVYIPIINDDWHENKETFRVFFWLPDGGGYIEEVSIIDDDANFNYNSFSNTLTVAGSSLLNSVPTADAIAIDVSGSKLKATVNGYTRSIDVAAVDRIVIKSGSGADTINLLATPLGTETLIYTGDQNDTINIGAGGSLSKILGNVKVDGGGGQNTMNLKDTVGSFAHGNMIQRSYDIDFEKVTRVGIGKIYYTGIEMFDTIQTLNLYTAASSDTFKVAGSNPATRFNIYGAAGNDTIVGPNTAQSWFINGANRGIFNNLDVHFYDVENLTGANGADTFSFLIGSSLTGNLKGGAGADTLKYLRYTPVSVNLATRKGTSISGTFDEFEAAVGGDHALDTFIGANANQSWTISDTNVVTVGTFAVTKFENLIGGTMADTFKFANGKSITGKIDGAAGTDTLNYSLYTSPITIDLPNKKYPGAASVSHIEAVVGGSASDKILGNGVSSGISQWGVHGFNSGHFTGSNTQLDFAGFENLTGYSNSDWFNFAAGGSISGMIDGAGGGDMLNYQSYGAPAIVNLATKTATGTGGFASVEWMTGSTTADTLVAPNSNNTWRIKAQNSGDLNGTQFTFFGVENLSGGSMSDVFVFSNSAGVSGVAEGGGNIDTLDYSAYAAGVQVDLTMGSATGTAAVTNFENATGGSGNDILKGNGADNFLTGNAGMDSLYGLGGADLLLGGWGEDLLDGGDGRDLLFGGINVDAIHGGNDEDLLVGGVTTHDNNEVALRLLLGQWKRTDLTYTQRVDLLRNEGAAGFKLNASTVSSDSAIDTLTGGSDLDWFWADLLGAAADQKDALQFEQVN